MSMPLRWCVAGAGLISAVAQGHLAKAVDVCGIILAGLDDAPGFAEAVLHFDLDLRRLRELQLDKFTLTANVLFAVAIDEALVHEHLSADASEANNGPLSADGAAAPDAVCCTIGNLCSTLGTLDHCHVVSSSVMIDRTITDIG